MLCGNFPSRFVKKVLKYLNIRAFFAARDEKFPDKSFTILIGNQDKFPQNYDLLHDCFICYDKDNLSVFQIE